MNVKRFGAILIAMLLIGTVLVPSTMAKKDKDNTVPSENQKIVDPTTPWDAQKALLVEEKVDKVLKQGLVGTSAFTTDHLTYIRTDTLDTSDSPYATASATYKLYKEDVTDASYDYYVVWMKSTGYNALDTGPFGDDSNLYEVRPGVTLNRANDRIIDWDPSTDTSTGTPITVTTSLSVSHGGVSAGISETYNLQQDHVGAQSSNTGQYGYFKAHWNGNYEGSQGVIGGTEIRVPKGASYGYAISLLVDGGQY
ncbi:MAG: hypothetical protein OIN85_02670 [Candidatus Methanoperedens sp.]|nr:hypothetical protein [Candidatus Methanoperedens sp.]